jgi:hypothetical protein
MPAALSTDDVLRLAPDASSAKSGQDLAHARKWVSTGRDDAALWGECQGSGAKPYQTQIDLGEMAFKCSCPSRKFPCKHGLGLMLLFAGSPAAVAPGERPAWVNEWLATRQAKAEKKAAAPKVEKPVDAKAQAERREARWGKVAAGLNELSLWLGDAIRAGIATMPSKGWPAFDTLARRLIDAQAPGVARRVRNLGTVVARAANWQSPFLAGIARLHLLCRAAELIDTLTDDERADVHAAVGMPISQDELTNRPVVKDRWQIVSKTVEIDEKLRAQRTWLVGTTTRRTAMILEFAHGTAPLDTSLVPGKAFDGEVAWYPGTGPRGFVKSSTVTLLPGAHSVGHGTWADAFDSASRAFAVNPWIDRFLLPLANVTPVSVGDETVLRDASGRATRVLLGDCARWQLYAVAGGSPVDVACEFDGSTIIPIAFASRGQVLPLAEDES